MAGVKLSIIRVRYTGLDTSGSYNSLGAQEAQPWGSVDVSGGNQLRCMPMDGENKPALVALRTRRETVIDALSTHFANDALDLDEFEQRVDLAHRAT